MSVLLKPKASLASEEAAGTPNPPARNMTSPAVAVRTATLRYFIHGVLLLGSLTAHVDSHTLLDRSDSRLFLREEPWRKSCAASESLVNTFLRPHGLPLAPRSKVLPHAARFRS